MFAIKSEMAQNSLAEFVSSDEENIVPNTLGSDSTDSDSDSPLPGVKRERSTVSLCNTTKRDTEENALGKPTRNFPGPGSSLPSKTKGLFSSSNIYAARNTFDVTKNAALNVNSDSDDDEFENIFAKKKPRSRGKAAVKKPGAARKRKSSTSDDAGTGQKRHVSLESDTEEPQDDSLKEYETKFVLLSEDEDTEVESDAADNGEFLSLSQTREPTPPPPPSVEVIDIDAVPRAKKSKRVTRSQKRQQKKANATTAAFTRVQTILDDMPNEPDVSIVEVTPTKSEAERELSVKIRSRSGIQRFSMKKRDSFADVVVAMARHEFVKDAQVTLYFNDRKIHVYDTPQSLDLQVADIVECYIRKVDEVESDDDDNFDDPDVLKIQVQGKDAKSRIMLPIRKDDPMEKIMREYCLKKHLAYDKVKFQFDGEDISPHDTPGDLELETNYCIDVNC